MHGSSLRVTKSLYIASSTSVFTCRRAATYPYVVEPPTYSLDWRVRLNLAIRTVEIKVVKMILVVLLAALISVAASQQGTPECTASTSALAAQVDCQWAVGNITAGTFSQDQFELACNDTLECNSLYRNFIQSCSVSCPYLHASLMYIDVYIMQVLFHKLYNS